MLVTRTVSDHWKDLCPFFFVRSPRRSLVAPFLFFLFDQARTSREASCFNDSTWNRADASNHCNRSNSLAVPLRTFNFTSMLHSLPVRASENATILLLNASRVVGFCPPQFGVNSRLIGCPLFLPSPFLHRSQ